MKRSKFKFFTFLSLFGLLTSCGNGSAKLIRSPNEVKDFNAEKLENDDFNNLRESVHDFSSRFASLAYKDFQNNKNITFSPFSLYSALALVTACAEGNTKDELLNALNVDFDVLNENYADLFELVSDKFDEGEISLTNSIWLNSNLDFKEDAINSLADNYYCYSYGADFTNDVEGANKSLTKFIEDKTKGLISCDLNASDSTLCFLLNTLYLKDNWFRFGQDLSEYNTPIDFKNSDGSTTNTTLYYGSYSSGNIYHGDTFSSYYIDTYNGLRLTFMVPNDGYSVDDIFTSENINLVTDVNSNDSIYAPNDDENKVTYFTRAIFPLFEAEFNNDLIEFLKSEFNILDLFSQTDCDLSGLLATRGVVTQVRHVTKLKTDRKGIEGAAITAVQLELTSPDIGATYKIVKQDFIVDKSFGFILTDNQGINLFSGVIEKI